MTLICAFDVATATGGCDGLVGAKKPRLWTWHTSDAGEGRPERLALFRRFLDSYFEEAKPDLVAYEKPLSLAVLMRIGASESTIMFLRGAIGVLEAGAAFAGIEVEGVAVQDARAHFCGRRTFARGTAKNEVLKVCRALGYKAEDEHQADAAAIWSLLCARANPRYAQVAARQLAPIERGPLFKHRRRNG